MADISDGGRVTEVRMRARLAALYAPTWFLVVPLVIGAIAALASAVTVEGCVRRRSERGWTADGYATQERCVESGPTLASLDQLHWAHLGLGVTLAGLVVVLFFLDVPAVAFDDTGVRWRNWGGWYRMSYDEIDRLGWATIGRGRRVMRMYLRSGHYVTLRATLTSTRSRRQSIDEILTRFVPGLTDSVNDR